MGSHLCLPRPSVCKSLEPTVARHSPLLDACFPVERSNLCVFAAVPPRFHPFCRTRPMGPLTFAFFLPLFPSACRQDEDTHCSLFCLLLPRCASRGNGCPKEPVQVSKQERRSRTIALWDATLAAAHRHSAVRPKRHYAELDLAGLRKASCRVPASSAPSLLPYHP